MWMWPKLYSFLTLIIWKQQPGHCKNHSSQFSKNKYFYWLTMSATHVDEEDSGLLPHSPKLALLQGRWILLPATQLERVEFKPYLHRREEVTSRPPFPFSKKWKWKAAQSCPTLCDPMDCSLPGSSVRGIFQARILEWTAISFSGGSSQPRDQTRVSCIPGRRFTVWTTREALAKNTVTEVV